MFKLRFAFPKYSQKRCPLKQFSVYKRCVFSTYHHYICGEDHETIIIIFFFLNISTVHSGSSHP